MPLIQIEDSSEKFPLYQGYRRELKKLLQKKSLKREKIKLASGKESHYYIDCKQVTLDSQGLFWACQLLYAWLEQTGLPLALGGPTLGADPLTAGLLFLAQERNHPLKGLIIRKEPKKHGSQSWIEGLENLPAGCEVVLLEDVVTTGGSGIRALGRLREAGFSVERVLGLVDREEGGEEAFQKEGCSFHFLYSAKELLEEGS